MAKINRVTQKIFAGEAPVDNTAVFGSMSTGAPNYTKDCAVIQSLPAYGQGWSAAVEADKAPYMEESTGLFYLLTTQLAYLYQMGVAEYDASTEYALNSFCQVGGRWYKSLIDNNIGNEPSVEVTAWKAIDLDSADKADIDLSNISQVGTTAIAHFGKPSSRNIDLTLGASGSTYVAPADGYFSLDKKSSGSNQYAFMSANYCAVADASLYNNYVTALTIPVSKGTECYVEYTLGGATNYFKFIYAEGAY